MRSTRISLAPGARAVIRDEEWFIRRVDEAHEVQGLQALVSTLQVHASVIGAASFSQYQRLLAHLRSDTFGGCIFQPVLVRCGAD